MPNKFYVTTPIYYVNDAPHIGHVYSTTMADILARYHRLWGEDVFFLTGTDEHAAKVADSAAQHAVTPLQWADRNAAAFQETFAWLGMTNNDFIRTTQPRHKDKVQQYLSELLKTGDVYSGEYEGWYDANQEEYIPDTKAKEYNYISPFNKKPLVRKKERNYFFRLSAYQGKLKALLEGQEVDGQRFRVLPEARCNEVLGRIAEGLNDVPISRAGGADWGIPFPGDAEHAVYVWIDALINYLSTVDTDERGKYWPADVHILAKDILWFHAVIWPAMLLALKRPLPAVVYAHSFWTSEGQKMSKSLGNFIDLAKVRFYVDNFGIDALRWFLATQGPFGTTDSDFSESKFIETFNTDLANDYGNLLNRVSGLIGKYFGGVVPATGPLSPEDEKVAANGRVLPARARQLIGELRLQEASQAVMDLVRQVNRYLEHQAPWKVAKTDLPSAGRILYTATEALRLASVLLQPVLPQKAGRVLEILGAVGSGETWGELGAGIQLPAHEALFPRAETKK